MAVTHRLRSRLLAVLITCVMMLSTLGGLAYVVSGAIRSMAFSADQMDVARALSAARGALAALKKQLSATIRDNAYWDDAYESLQKSDAQAWATENWGATTADYPLYDTAIVMNADGKPLIAYHKGIALGDAETERFFLGNLSGVATAARNVDFADDNLPVAFVKTRDGLALVGAAAVQPSVHAAFDIKTAKVLLFSKQMTSDVVAELANTFSIEGLVLSSGAGDRAMLHADALDIYGREIAKVTWPPMHPGTVSYDRVRPALITAALVVLTLLGAVAVSGLVVFRGCWFSRGTEPVFSPRSEPPLSMVF